MPKRRRNPYARPDPRTRSAKAAGYPARSVHKLREIDRRFHLLKAGQKVLDLGAAPGSWSKYAAEKVGARGTVVSVDLQAIEAELGSNVIVIQGDALLSPVKEVLDHAPYDVVLSDMAPKTSGSKPTDQARSFELFMHALEATDELLRPGGGFTGKIFMSEDYPHAKSAVADRFETCRSTKPNASRQNSSELFLVGLGRLSFGKREEPSG